VPYVLRSITAFDTIFMVSTLFLPITSCAPSSIVFILFFRPLQQPRLDADPIRDRGRSCKII
jgi:hypothetical protein